MPPACVLRPSAAQWPPSKRASRNCAASLQGGAGRHEWAQPAGCFSGRVAGDRDRHRRRSQRSSRAWARAPERPTARRRAAAIAAALATLASSSGRDRDALGRGERRWLVAAIHALRDRGAVARIRGGTALRLGVHLRDLGHRRGLRAFRGAHRAAARRARCKIDSPFDYRSQARIYLPRGMPEPQHPGFADKFIDACAPLARGERRARVPALHQLSWIGRRRRSLSRLDFPTPPFPVLVQGQAPREALLSQFRELGNAVLLATGSFWEGVDVKGEALSIVAIDKLPFASPDDPLAQSAPRGHSPPRRQSILRVPIAAGGAGAEAGGRAPDSRLR